MESNAPSYTTVTRWVKHFLEGREDVNDDPRSATPVSQFSGENIELIRQVTSNDPHSAYHEIIAETYLSPGTVERIVRDCLKMKKVRSRGVSHQLTHEQRVKLCRENLATFQNGSCRLYDIKQVIKRGFTIDRFITSQRTQADLVKVNHQLL